MPDDTLGKELLPFFQSPSEVTLQESSRPAGTSSRGFLILLTIPALGDKDFSVPSRELLHINRFIYLLPVSPINEPPKTENSG